MNYSKKIIIVFIGIFSFYSGLNSMEDPHYAQNKIQKECSNEQFLEQLRDTIAQKFFQLLKQDLLEYVQLNIQFTKGYLNEQHGARFLELQEGFEGIGLFINQDTTEESLYDQIRNLFESFDLQRLIALQKKLFPLIKKKQARKQ